MMAPTNTSGCLLRRVHRARFCFLVAQVRTQSLPPRLPVFHERLSRRCLAQHLARRKPVRDHPSLPGSAVAAHQHRGWGQRLGLGTETKREAQRPQPVPCRAPGPGVGDPCPCPVAWDLPPPTCQGEGGFHPQPRRRSWPLLDFRGKSRDRQGPLPEPSGQAVRKA